MALKKASALYLGEGQARAEETASHMSGAWQLHRTELISNPLITGKMGWKEGGQGPLCVTVTVPTGDLIFFFYPISEGEIGGGGVFLFVCFNTLKFSFLRIQCP